MSRTIAGLVEIHSRRTFLLIVVVALAAIAFTRVSEAQTTTFVDPQTLKLGPIRHAQLPPYLIKRVRAFEPVFADVYPITHEKWIEGFRRDVHPEREIEIWEQSASAFSQFTSGRHLSLEVRKEVLGLLLFRSGATAEDTLKHVKLKYLSQEEARELISLYKASPQPVTAVK